MEENVHRCCFWQEYAYALSTGGSGECEPLKFLLILNAVVNSEGCEDGL